MCIFGLEKDMYRETAVKFSIDASLMTRMPQIVLDQIQSHALQGLHILRSPISRLRILRPRCPDLVLFLGFRVDFFFHLCMIYKIALP